MRREAFETPGEVTLDLRVAQGRVELEGSRYSLRRKEGRQDRP